MAVVSPEYKFTFGEVTFIEYLTCLTAYAFIAFEMPKTIDRPSSLFLIVTILMIYIPTTVIIVGSFQPNGSNFDWPMLTVMTVGFVIACRLVSRLPWLPGDRESSRSFEYVLMFIWISSAMILVLQFGSIMQFATLDTIYVQREIASVRDVWEGYLQTYFGYVFSPTLLAIGLNKRLAIPIVMGFAGALILFMITAEKAALTYPFLLIGAWFALKHNYKWLLHVNFIATAFAIISFWATLYYQTVYAANFVAAYFVSRSVMIPGACVVYYADYFGQNGYTYLSHLRGFNQFISTPLSYAGNPRWPSLGHLVGEEYIGIRTLNANASFIASDGMASFGYLGVIISLVLFAIFLIYVDKFSRGLPSAFVVTALVPLALTCTNLSLFTLMLSFGGFLTLISLKYQFKTIKLDAETINWRLA